MKKKFILGIILITTAGLISGVGAGMLITKLHPKDRNTYNEDTLTASTSSSDSNSDKQSSKKDKNSDTQNNKTQTSKDNNTQSDKKNVPESQNNDTLFITQDKAESLINENDGKILKSFGTPKLVSEGIASETTVNALNDNYKDMDIDEKLYTFSLYVTKKDLNDYSVLGSPVYLYYVGADSEKVYRVSGNDISDIVEMEDNEQVKVHNYKDEIKR